VAVGHGAKVYFPHNKYEGKEKKVLPVQTKKTTTTKTKKEVKD
jgi:hypothetical protein